MGRSRKIALQTGLPDERSMANRERMTTAIEAQEMRIESLQESEDLLGREDKAKFYEKKAQTMTPPMFLGEQQVWHTVRVWAASLTDNCLQIFQDWDKMRSKHDLESLQLRWPETEDRREDCTSSINTIHPEPEIHEHIHVTKKATEQCVQLQAHSEQR